MKRLFLFLSFYFQFIIISSQFSIGEAFAQDTSQRSPEAEALLQCFREIYGEKIISGCTANVNWNINEAKWVNQHTGKWPAINFFDFIHLPFSPSSWITPMSRRSLIGTKRAESLVACGTGICQRMTVRTGPARLALAIKKPVLMSRRFSNRSRMNTSR